MIRRTSLALLFFLIAQASNPVFAQEQKKKVLVDEDFLKAAELAIAERDKFKTQVDALNSVIAAKNEQILNLRGLLDVEKQISSDWKEAALARKSVIATDDRIMTIYDKRVATLEADLSAARRSQKVWGAVGFILGAGLGWAAKK